MTKKKTPPASSAGATTKTTDAAAGANGQDDNPDIAKAQAADAAAKAERKAKREAQEKAESAFTGAWKKLASRVDAAMRSGLDFSIVTQDVTNDQVYEIINAGDEALAALFPPEKSEAELKADRSEALARLTKGEITEDEFSTIAAKIGAKINRIRAAKKKADKEAAAAAAAKAAAEGQSEQASA